MTNWDFVLQQMRLHHTTTDTNWAYERRTIRKELVPHDLTQCGIIERLCINNQRLFFGEGKTCESLVAFFVRLLNKIGCRACGWCWNNVAKMFKYAWWFSRRHRSIIMLNDFLIWGYKSVLMFSFIEIATIIISENFQSVAIISSASFSSYIQCGNFRKYRFAYNAFYHYQF